MAKKRIHMSEEEARQLYDNINAYYIFLQSAVSVDKCSFEKIKFWNPVMNNHLRKAHESIGALMRDFKAHFSNTEQDIVMYDYPSELYRVLEFFKSKHPDTISEIMDQLEQQEKEINQQQ